ncbi:MAG: ComEC/Rec2 family competence protein [Elusimicrobiota bacterium]
MPLFSYLARRPFILITLAYIAVLISLDSSGYFDRAPADDISRSAPLKNAVIDGCITDAPEFKNGRFSAIVKTTALNGRPARGRIFLIYPKASGEFQPGDIVTLRDNLNSITPPKKPGGFDFRKYLSRKSVYSSAYAFRIRKSGGNKRPFIMKFADCVADDITGTVKARLPEREAGVLIKMLIGGKGAVSPDDKTKFTDAGVIHILVVSGMNVAYVAAFFAFLFRISGFSGVHSLMLSVPFIFLYTLVTGANPPIARASIMASFVIFSYALSRDSNIYQSLSMAAFVILLREPQALFTPSFQLSFAATIGIVYFYPVLVSPFRGLHAVIRAAAATAAVTLSAQLAVNPLLALYFEKISLIGLISNIIIVPLAGIVTITGLALYLLSVFLPWLAGTAAAVNYHLVRLVLFFVDFFSGLKYASVHVPAPSIRLIIAYYIGIVVFFGIISSRVTNEKER